MNPESLDRRTFLTAIVGAAAAYAPAPVPIQTDEWPDEAYGLPDEPMGMEPNEGGVAPFVVLRPGRLVRVHRPDPHDTVVLRSMHRLFVREEGLSQAALLPCNFIEV